MQHKSQETIEQIIVYVEDYFKSNGYSPTITQIGKALGIARCTVHRYIDYMKENGVLYGFGSRPELEDAGADGIAESVPDLRKLLMC